MPFTFCAQNGLGLEFVIFSLLTGGALLLASIGRGLLCYFYGPTATFAVGAAFGICSIGIVARVV